ncbi:hypothetical protein BDR07DRAFT_1413081 [Suillus spraguei]|nr:hypothetical protein BDR07DRAFT_1413081 [Suillus spraguei]
MLSNSAGYSNTSYHWHVLCLAHFCLPTKHTFSPVYVSLKNLFFFTMDVTQLEQVFELFR